MPETSPRENTRLVLRESQPVSSYEEMKQQQVELAAVEDLSAFRMRAQLLDRGRTETVLASSKQMTVRLKVYASGGENALHAHANEDHVFILLQGKAEFFDQNGALGTLGVNEGLLIPRGVYYRFNATGSEPLVMLRIGSPNEAAMGLEGRVDVHGSFQHADSAQNKTEPVVFKPGAFFG